MAGNVSAGAPAKDFAELDARQRATFRRCKMLEKRLRRIEDCLQLAEMPDPGEGRSEDEYDGQ